MMASKDSLKCKHSTQCVVEKCFKSDYRVVRRDKLQKRS